MVWNFHASSRLRLHYTDAASQEAPIRYGMYNFQKLSETTFLRCNNSSKNSVHKKSDTADGFSQRYGKLCGTSVNVEKFQAGLKKQRLSGFIISMTKLLDADWLRGVQLFH